MYYFAVGLVFDTHCQTSPIPALFPDCSVCVAIWYLTTSGQVNYAQCKHKLQPEGTVSAAALLWQHGEPG